MTPPGILLFCMPEFGHLKRLLPLIAGLAQAGADVHVFSDMKYAQAINTSGGRCHDLFRDRPLALADNQSRPIPSRYVSFAARFAESVISEVAALKPRIVIHDAFAVIAVPVANRLGLPRINVCPGHNLAPAPTVAALARDPRVQLSDDCLRAVDILRRDHGMPDASAFSYITSLSRELNLICEPPEFLTASEAQAFSPHAFFGSLAEVAPPGPAAGAGANDFPGADTASLRIYASLGTVVWRYYADYARSILDALAQAAHKRRDLRVLIGLGGQSIDTGLGKLEAANIRVESYVDQWRVLAGSDVFLTHQGLNSTHEAIYHGVAMISCPFFSDQPGLAKRCQEFGLAEPLVAELRGAVDEGSIIAALDRIAERQDDIRARLRIARGWELAVMARRPEVIARIIAFA